MAGFFDSVAQEDGTKVSETVEAPMVEATVESAETASVSAFFAIPTTTPDMVIIEDDGSEGTMVEAPIEAPAETAIAMTPTPVASASDDTDMDANAIILEAIAKMSALRDRSAAKRDAIMTEVEDINAQIAALKERAKERTNSAKDIAAEMKKVEDSIAVLQAQKLA